MSGRWRCVRGWQGLQRSGRCGGGQSRSRGVYRGSVSRYLERHGGLGGDLLMLGPRSLRLLSLASVGLAEVEDVRVGTGGVLTELSELLGERNGFYAFESSLHVFASGAPAAAGTSLKHWNAEDGWRAGYGGMADGFVFFAEDVFGGQFAVRDNIIFTFDPESGAAEVMASSIEDWADQVLSSYGVPTGFPVAHTWQQLHDVLPTGNRLVPKRPFDLGDRPQPAIVRNVRQRVTVSPAVELLGFVHLLKPDSD